MIALILRSISWMGIQTVITFYLITSNHSDIFQEIWNKNRNLLCLDILLSFSLENISLEKFSTSSPSSNFSWHERKVSIYFLFFSTSGDSTNSLEKKDHPLKKWQSNSRSCRWSWLKTFTKTWHQRNRKLSSTKKRRCKGKEEGTIGREN